MRLIMNEGHEYVIYGKTIRAGEEFDVPENEAKIWQQLGRARKKDELPKRGPGRPRKQEESQPRYDRRDMRAEDE